MSRPLVRNGFLVFGEPAPSGECPRDVVLHGDCAEVLTSLPAASVDLVLTDPPYLVNYRDRHGRTVANDNDSRWLRPVFHELYRVLKPDSFLISFYGWNAVDSFMRAWRGAGFRPVGHVVLVKDYASSSRYLRHHHEQAYVLAKGRPQAPGLVLQDVLRFPYTGNRFHPTQKPIEPLMQLISSFSAPGDLILDPFCGSGTTLRAARKTCRSYLGIELDETHVQTARYRCERP